MRIVFVDTMLTTPPFGGAHSFMVALSQELARANTVFLVTQPGSDGSLCTALERIGVRIIAGLWRSSHLPEQKADRLARWILVERPDVFVLSNSVDTGWLALPSLPPDLPTITIAHNDVPAYYLPNKYYGAFIDCAVGVSAEVQRKLTSEAAIPSSRTRQIPYGVAALSEEAVCASQRARAGSAMLRIGYVGRVERLQKRVFDIVAVAQHLVSRGVLFRLDVVGDGPDRDRFETEVRSRGLGNHVRLRGWLTGKELEAAYRDLDIFLLMSDHEGLPVALLEAMGNALVPVVSATVSGNTELVRDGENGYLVAVGDVAGFAGRLAELAGNPAQLARMSFSAWRTSQDYSIGRMVSGYKNLFQELSNQVERPHRCLGPKPSLPMPSCRSRYPVWLRKTKSIVRAVIAGEPLW